MLARNSWTESGIREAIEASVLVQARAGRVELAGPGVALSPRLVMAMSLAMHELTTNAIKYGALSEGGGRVAISWAVSEAEGKRLLTIDWRELGGPGWRRQAAQASDRGCSRKWPPRRVAPWSFRSTRPACIARCGLP